MECSFRKFCKVLKTKRHNAHSISSFEWYRSTHPDFQKQFVTPCKGNNTTFLCVHFSFIFLLNKDHCVSGLRPFQKISKLNLFDSLSIVVLRFFYLLETKFNLLEFKAVFCDIVTNTIFKVAKFPISYKHRILLIL